MTTHTYVVQHVRKNQTIDYQSFLTDAEAFAYYGERCKLLRSRRGPYVPEAVTVRHKGTLVASTDRPGRNRRLVL